MSGELDSDFGFAIQPLVQKFKGQIFAVNGQFQLPVYKGPVLSALFASQASQILRQKIKQNALEPLEYLQIIVRSSAENAQLPWFPAIEPTLQLFTIPDKAKLVKYVLHAKHGKLTKKENVGKGVETELWSEIVSRAKELGIIA